MMSLFENEGYRWRETYFVLFRSKDRPSAEAIIEWIKTLGPRYEVQELRRDEQGLFESLTLLSPDDFAAMDITYIVGEEVQEQVSTLCKEVAFDRLGKQERRKWDRLKSCDARFDIYHFEQVVLPDGEEDDESFLDPGALLIVLQHIAKLCHGVGVDPQSGTLV
ncbi:MAG: hypothetical protein FJ276_31885 [Planctomycetes bacterium]|nr:hypothetical protein [Planctomycetota bacterium]